MNAYQRFLIRHRVYCELCSAPMPATKVCQIQRRPHWPETKTVVVCDAHWRANSPVEAGLTSTK
jgi:hypothetical protein